MRSHIYKPHTPQQTTYIFEDGNQTRGFIRVNDIAKANLNALEHNNANYKAINIGTGKPTTIKNLAETSLKKHK
jgi:nucleoside-diphosphate-sugar epimerase